MTQTVYIDILLALNGFVDYFILLAVCKINRCDTRWFRLLLGAALGAVFSLIVFVNAPHAVWSVAVRLGAAALIVLTAFGFRNLKRFVRLLGSLFAVTVSYAGLMLAVWFIMKPAGMVVNNGVVYFNISPLVLLISTAACYTVVTLTRHVLRRGVPTAQLYRVEATLGHSTVAVNALLDTGNELEDLFTGAPVAVIQCSTAQQLLPPEARPVFMHGADADQLPAFMQDRYRMIPYSAVSGRGMLSAFRSDGFVLWIDQQPYRLSNVILAVSEEDFKGEYQALIGPSMLRDATINASASPLRHQQRKETLFRRLR